MNKSTVLLLALLLVLGAIVFLVLPSDEDRMTSDPRLPVSFTVDSASIVGLSIVRSGNVLSIGKVGGVWTIISEKNLPADPSAVGQVIGGFSRFKVGSLVSDNPSKQALFQVDSTGSLVTFTDRDGNERSIIVGKMGPSFSEVYFRIPSSADVYLGSGITTWSLNKDLRDWRNKTIFASPAESVTGIRIVSAGKSLEYEKDSTGWTSGRVTVPTETINPILNILAGIRADDFIDSTVEFGEAPATVVVSGAVDATLNFYRLNSDTNKYAVVSSESPQVYLVGNHVASQLFKSVGEPKAVSVPVVRRAASSAGSTRTSKISTPAAKITPPTTRTTKTSTPPPVKREVAKVPETSQGGTDPLVGSKPNTATGNEPVNPFRQRPADEKRPGSDAVPPPPAGSATSTGTITPSRSPVTTTPPPAQTSGQGADDDGELNVHIVKRGETMTTIAKDYGVTVEQLLKWNLLKSISVRPGQELYVFVRK